jgi:hypothetical protein
MLKTPQVFCNRLQWYTLEALILSFQKRLALGVRLELVPLMQIPGSTPDGERWGIIPKLQETQKITEL